MLRFLLASLAAVALAAAGASSAHVLDRALAQHPKATGTTLGEVLTHILATDDVSTWKHHGSVKALQLMFASPSVDKAELHKAAGEVDTHTVDDTQVAWIKHLRTKFPKESDCTPHPKVHIRGAGPTGLAAALFAKANGAKTVHAVNDYSRYYRQHTVSTTVSKSIGDLTGNGGVGKVKPNGAESVVSGLLGIKIKEEANDLISPEWYKAIKWHGFDTGRFIMVSDLEKMMALAAHVVGVHFSFTKPEAADVPSRQSRRVEGRDSTAAAFTLTACAAYSPGKKTEQDNVKDYDILVGAEGPGSPTRNHYLTGVQMTVPKCHTANHKYTFKNKDYAISTDLATQGLVSVGFVVDSSTAAGLQFCDAASSMWKGPAGSVIKGYYVKKFTEHNVCQLEITLTKQGGHLVRKAFTSSASAHTCSFNFNMFGGTKANSAELTKRLALLKHFLETGYDGAVFGAPGVDEVMDSVREFKFWENNLRMATADDSNEHMNVKAYMGKKITVKRTVHPAPVEQGQAPVEQGQAPVEQDQAPAEQDQPQMVVILGDAVRDALPDSGMGVNDGAHQAQEFGKLVADYKSVNRPTDMTKFNTWLDGIQTHEGKVVCGLHENVLKNYMARAVQADLVKDFKIRLKASDPPKELTLSTDNTDAALATSITSTVV